MVKNTKKGSVNHGKPITEFFKRAPKTPTSTPPSAARPSATLVKEPTAKAPAKAKIKSQVTGRPDKSADSPNSPATPSNPAMADSAPSSSQPEGSNLDDHSDVFLSAHESSPGSRKRTRSPSPEPLHRASSSRSAAARGKSISPIKPTALPFRKKTRHDSPQADIEQTIVPSSQSDEEDLCMEPIPKPNTANANSADHGMSSDKDEASSNASVSLPPSPMLSEDQSSPVSNRQSMPPTPVALTKATKAAQMIAEIKQKAYAKEPSSPEPASLTFDADMISSDDDDELLPLQIIEPSNAKNPAATAVSTRQSARLKGRSVSPSPQARTTRASSSRLSPPIIAKKPAPKARVDVPFESLLKERRLAVKKGVDEAALRLAEETAKRIAKTEAEDIKLDDDDDDLDSWNPTGSVQDPKTFIEQLGMSRDGTSGFKPDLDDETRKTLFGAQEGKGALDILNDDLLVQEHDQSTVKHAGVPFWLPCTDAADIMATDQTLPRPPTTLSPCLIILNECIRRQDTARAANILYCNFMLSVGPSERDSTVLYLYDLVFSPSSHPEALQEAAFHALYQFWTTPDSSDLTFAKFLETILFLGANPQILSHQDWKLPEVSPSSIDESRRQTSLWRLLSLVKGSSSIPPEDVPDTIILLMLIGMDSKATPDFLLEIAQVIDGLGRSLISESTFCAKVIKAGASYEAVNKDRLVSLLSTGSGAIRRVASFVAYAFVTDQSNLQPEIYSEMPPLGDILSLLNAHSKFTVDKDTDYVDLGFFVNMLAVAISDLRSYAFRERGSSSQASQGERPKTDLQRLHKALETMHSNIADTRATHLERSRTKAVIKGLAMTVHYQREFWIKHGAPERPKTLAQYFHKK